MKREDFTPFLRRKVRLTLKANNYFYTGTITSVNDTSFAFTDKFGKDFKFSFDAISVVEAMP